MNINHRSVSDFRTFLIVWFGQLVSLAGTGMTRFALLIWAYQQTGSATTLALLGFFAFGSYVLVSPVAGIYIDHFDRRWVMVLSDFGSGIVTITLLVLYSGDSLAIWHLYVAQTALGALDAFQVPAYTAATTLLIPKAHYARASGMRSLAISLSEVGAPFAAGTLLAVIGIAGVLMIDVVTFVCAMFTLLIVRFPSVPEDTRRESQRHEPLARQLTFGLRYIWARPGLRGLLLIFSGVILFATLTYFSILPAMILARSGGDEMALAVVQAVLGIGGVVGGVVLTVWGGPGRKIHGALGATALSFLLGDLLFATGQTVPVWVLGAFVATFFIPFIDGGYLAIWQSKVHPAVQGRVFSVRTMIQQATRPFGYLAGGLLADHVFGPAMMPDGVLADALGWLVGVGPGAGMGVMFLCTAVLGFSISISGYFVPAVHNIERDLPDFDADDTPESTSDIVPEPVTTP
jgi:MFS transporter, DHA3 family, macrolide efflux protein